MGWADLANWARLSHRRGRADLGPTPFYLFLWGRAGLGPELWAGPDTARPNIHCMSSGREL
jgi:hypothetical protein